MKSFVSLSDIHWPYEDKECMRLVTEFLGDFRPDILVLNGDLHDMPAISKFSMRRPEILKTTPLQDQLDYGIGEMEKLIQSAHPREVKYALGNHEDRWDAYLGSEAKALASLKCLDFDQVFKLQGIEWKKYGDGFWLNDSLFIYHGGFVGANWTEKERKHIGGSSITGHQHMQGVTYHRDRSRSYKNIGQGCLCKLDPPYLRTPPNWQQGFVAGFIYDSDKFRAVEIEIVQGKDSVWMAPFGEKIYSVKKVPDLRRRKAARRVPSLEANEGRPQTPLQALPESPASSRVRSQPREVPGEDYLLESS